MENHILWFFLCFLILQYFTAFDTLLHLGGFDRPFSFGYWILKSYDLMIVCLFFSSCPRYVNSLNRP
jgi:hypothetical protein